MHICDVPKENLTLLLWCSSAGLDVRLRHRWNRGVDASYHHPRPQAQRQDGRVSPQRRPSLAAPRLKDTGSEVLKCRQTLSCIHLTVLYSRHFFFYSLDCLYLTLIITMTLRRCRHPFICTSLLWRYCMLFLKSAIPITDNYYQLWSHQLRQDA